MAVMTRTLRWLAVPVVAYGVWYGGIILAIKTSEFIFSFCPPDKVVSVVCTEPLFISDEHLILAFTALVAAGIVLSTGVVAPSHRFPVAVIAYCGGAAFAIYVAKDGGIWSEFITAGVSGALALYLAARLWRKRPGEAHS